MVVTAKTPVQLLVQKGFQVEANVAISNTAYFIQSAITGSEMSLFGYATSTIGGIVSGATFNAPIKTSLQIATGLEIASYGEVLYELLSKILFPRSFSAT